MSDIKLVKLKSGEELIGDVTVLGDSVTISDPCQLIPTPEGVGFTPWPNMAKPGPVTISRDWVVCLATPVEPARDGWNSKFGSGIILAPNMQLNG